MLKQIQALVGLQTALLEAFRVRYPEVSDWRYLLDAPKSGQLALGSEVWRFARHGSGIRFESGGTLVDVHKHCDDPSLFDAWRLSSFLGSRDESGVERELGKLADDGQLRRIGDGYSLGARREPRRDVREPRPAAAR